MFIEVIKKAKQYKTHQIQHVIACSGDDGLFFDVGQKLDQFLGRFWQESRGD